MKIEEAICLIKQELERAEKLHPVWPKDRIHAAAVVSEESGELVRACNNYHFNLLNGKYEEFEFFVKDIETEAIHTAVTAIRFLINLKHEKWDESKTIDLEPYMDI